MHGLLFNKAFVIFIGLFFCLSFVFFTFLTVLSFLFIKTGLLFLGGLIGLIGCLTINFIILYLIYCFIANKNVKAGLMGLLFIFSLIIGGVAIGLIIISVKDFTIINNEDSEYLTRTEETIKLDNKTFIENNYYRDEVKFIETNSKDIKIVYTHSPFCSIKSHYGNNNNYYYLNCSDNKNVFKETINLINKKIFVKPDYLSVKVYASKENINKLNSNRENYYKETENKSINQLREKIQKLEDELNLKENKINELIYNCSK